MTKKEKIRAEFIGDEYKIPEEVQNLFLEYIAFDELRDKYVEQRFGYRKSKKAAFNAQKKRKEFWSKVYDIYPEFSTVSSKQYTIFYETKLGIIKKEAVKDK